MKVNGKHFRTVWMDGSTVFMIDQTKLPFEFIIFESKSYKQSCYAIKTMITRGAGAIGVTAGFAMAQAFIEAPDKNFEDFIENAKRDIGRTRPTARNLFYAVDRVFNAGKKSLNHAIMEAQQMAEESMVEARQIGINGDVLINDGYQIATHCNAGWLGFVDYGSALSPLYIAKEKGKNVFVYVDETRPRSQGARLTAWELNNENIAHAIIADNALAFYMSKKKIDLMIVGADRVAANGDVANKIGTLEKAILAKEFGVPFYVAAPLSTVDMNCPSGNDIIIEERDQEEVLYQAGLDENGALVKVQLANPGSIAFNPAFDVTPSKYVSGIITEKGILDPNSEPLQKFYS